MPKKKSKKKIKKILAKKSSSLHSETKKGVLVVVFFTLAVISLLSFLGVAGVFGEYVIKFSRLFFGRGFFLISISFALAGLAILLPGFNFSAKNKPIYRTILIGMALFVFSILGFFHILSVKILNGNGNEISEFGGFAVGSGGGYLGMVLGYPLVNFLGFWASLVVLLAILTISILVTFNISLIPSRLSRQDKDEKNKGAALIINGEKKGSLPLEKKKGIWQRFKEKSKLAGDGSLSGKLTDLSDNKTSNTGDHILGRVASPDEKIKTGSNSDPKKQDKDSLSISISDGLNKQFSGFKLPPLEFLEREVGRPMSGDIKANINIIKGTLQNFGIDVEMAEVNVGPTVTQYTLRPAQGIKLSKITALQNDLSLALAAHPIRIEAPIPKRSLVGIEIPNKSIMTVRLRTILERPAFQEADAGLVLALGRDVAGNPVFADLARMPHMLVAGATGTGKTVALNSIILSLLYRGLPENLKLILIDPKRVELTAYSSIPHLLTPVIVKPDKAVGALRWAVGEMERRFGVLQEAGKRDVASYNKQQQKLRGKNGASESERLPYIIIIIDELADLMSSYGREAEGAIVRIAQMARAVGIHLIVSTQRPSVEIITGLIKANITTRMAFQVASQIDSRTILDMAGAEKLLGNGDMLFLAGNAAKPIRVQGGYVSEGEIKKVADYLRKSSEPDYKDELDSVDSKASGGSLGIADSEADDELYEEAKAEVIRAGKASSSLLQRRLRVGYARAARLIDILEDRGVVGPADGAKPRNVYEDGAEEIEVGE